MSNPATFASNLALFGAALALAGAAHAQTGAAGGDAPPRSAAPSITSPTGGVAPGASAAHELPAARVSKLRGVNIYDAGAKKIGELKDMVVDPATGRVIHTVVSIGGVLGVGDKLHAVTAGQLRVYSRATNDPAPVRVELTAAPDGLPLAEKLDKDSPYLLASRLMDMDVRDASGKEVGEVEDLVVDLQTGEVKVALVEFDDAWAPDDRLFAVPVGELRRDANGKDLTLDVTRESLAQRPSVGERELDKIDLAAQPWMRASR